MTDAPIQHPLHLGRQAVVTLDGVSGQLAAVERRETSARTARRSGRIDPGMRCPPPDSRARTHRRASCRSPCKSACDSACDSPCESACEPPAGLVSTWPRNCTATPPWASTAVVTDLRFAARLAGRSPAAALLAILSLALGIGANTAVFSLIDTLVLRPLPIAEPDRVFQVVARRPRRRRAVRPAACLRWHGFARRSPGTQCVGELSALSGDARRRARRRPAGGRRVVADAPHQGDGRRDDRTGGRAERDRRLSTPRSACAR